MQKLTLKTTVLAICLAVGAVWLALTLVALGLSIVGGDPLYTAYPGGLVLPHLSLFGRVYLVTSILMPFVVIGAIVSA